MIYVISNETIRNLSHIYSENLPRSPFEPWFIMVFTLDCAGSWAWENEPRMVVSINVLATIANMFGRILINSLLYWNYAIYKKIIIRISTNFSYLFRLIWFRIIDLCLLKVEKQLSISVMSAVSTFISRIDCAYRTIHCLYRIDWAARRCLWFRHEWKLDLYALHFLKYFIATT